MTASKPIDIRAVLADRRQIAVIWGIEDVREVRPDLTADQCWAVLRAAERTHDANFGISWDTLCCDAQMLFGPAPARRKRRRPA